MSVSLAVGTIDEVAGPKQALIPQPDAMRNGLTAMQNPSDRVLASHAVEVIQRDAFANERRTREALMGRVFGSHLVHQLRHEQQCLAQFRRAGVPSSMTGLEISLGVHDKIDWSDVLNAPENRMKAEDPHVALEKRHDAMGW